MFVGGGVENEPTSYPLNVLKDESGLPLGTRGEEETLYHSTHKHSNKSKIRGKFDFMTLFLSICRIISFVETLKIKLNINETNEWSLVHRKTVQT